MLNISGYCALSVGKLLEKQILFLQVANANISYGLRSILSLSKNNSNHRLHPRYCPLCGRKL